MKFSTYMKRILFIILPLSIIFGVIMNFYHIPLAYQLTVNIMMGIIVGWIIIEIKKKKEIAKVNEERKQWKDKQFADYLNISSGKRHYLYNRDITSMLERTRIDKNDDDLDDDLFAETIYTAVLNMAIAQNNRKAIEYIIGKLDMIKTKKEEENNDDTTTF